jgi:voltage-gated potassium channel
LGNLTFSARAILRLAYFLDSSQKYKSIKHFFYEILEDNSNVYKKYLDIFMIFIILSSVLILIREVKHELTPELLFYNNYVVSILFLTEYILRFWVYSDISKELIDRYENDIFLQRDFNIYSALYEALTTKLKYVTSLRAIIDLLAIMPFFHELRLFRIFILFRIFKLFRYAKSINYFISVLGSKKVEFATLGIFVSTVVFISGILIYIMEANNPASKINTLFEAFYWSVVTISTVGYGDFVPATSAGQVVAMIIIISGVGVISFLTSIVVSAFSERLFQMKEDKLVSTIAHLKNIYLICGYDDVSSLVALKLQKNSKVIILDSDKERVEKAHIDGFTALNLDPASLSTYKKLGINFAKNVKSVLCLRADDVLNVYSALTIRSIDKNVNILSILMEKHNHNKLLFAGVNDVVYTQELVGLMAREYSGKPVAFEAIHALRSENRGVYIEEFFITNDILKYFNSIEELNVTKYKLILLGIYKDDREKFEFNPKNDLTLGDGDILVVIGMRSLINEFKNFMIKKRVRL